MNVFPHPTGWLLRRPGDRGKVATIVAGPGVEPGRDDATYSHYALLRSIETLFHLPLLGHAGDPATATIPTLS